MAFRPGTFQTTISGTNVTVQALNTGRDASRPLPRQVLANSVVNTPTRPVQQSGSGSDDAVISKLLLKCVSREAKKESKTFLIRNIRPAAITSCNALKALIKAQYGNEIRDSFDIGYLSGTIVVNLRSSEDLRELWVSVLQGTKVNLWCDGLKAPGRKRQIGTDDSDDDAEEVSVSKQANKKKRKKDSKDSEEHSTASIIKSLKDAHGNTKYTPMQYTIWAEMIHGGIHASQSEPPTSSMFLRAGGATPTKKNPNDAITQAITQIASVLSPTSGPSPRSGGQGASPAKVIDCRSKCYKQLTELSSLKQSGLLSNEDYCSEREAIMSTLKNLKGM